MIFYKNNELIVRRLERDDKHLIVKWLSDKQVLQYYEGRNNPHDYDLVEVKFYSEDIHKTRCIIEYSHIPIGYIQFYPVSEEEREEYGYANYKGTIFGTDQFIGETKYWGQGIGTVIMKSMITFLTTIKGVEKITLDPQSWNQRAIKCYEKSGFIKVKLLPKHELHEGELKDCYLMEYAAVHIV